MAVFDVQSALGARLRRSHVEVRSEGADTLVLRRVPANRRFFTKASTNLLLKRSGSDAPVVIAVDHDLGYTGCDPVLLRAFAGGVTEQGWRVILIDERSPDRLESIVGDALSAVGFDGVEPIWPPTAPAAADRDSTLLRELGTDLSRHREQPTDAIGRIEAIATVTAMLLQRSPCLPIVVGEPGVGKSHLLRVVAARLAALRPAQRLVRVDLGCLFVGAPGDAERDRRLESLFEALPAPAGPVVAVERLELVASETRYGRVSLASALEAGHRIVATTEAAGAEWFDLPPLGRHVRVVRVEALAADDTREVLQAMLPVLAGAHRVSIADGCVAATVRRAEELRGHFPGKALALLDAACARARVDSAPTVGLEHVYMATSGFTDTDE